MLKKWTRPPEGIVTADVLRPDAVMVIGASVGPLEELPPQATNANETRISATRMVSPCAPPFPRTPTTVPAALLFPCETRRDRSMRLIRWYRSASRRPVEDPGQIDSRVHQASGEHHHLRDRLESRAGEETNNARHAR